MKYKFKLLCAVCQKEEDKIFEIDPSLPGEDLDHTCECGNVLRIDDHELVFIADVEKAEEIIF